MSHSTLTTGAKVLAQRLKYRRLPDIPTPITEDPELARSLDSVKEHLRMYEGDTGAPKERFVTLQELADAGLVTADVKNKFAFIAQVQGQDVVQAAGTAERTIRTVINNNVVTGASALSDLIEVDAAGSGGDTFLKFAGSEYTPFFLFKGDNSWTGVQGFAKPIVFQERSSTPVPIPGQVFVWVKNTVPSSLWYTDDAGNEVQLA